MAERTRPAPAAPGGALPAGCVDLPPASEGIVVAFRVPDAGPEQPALGPWLHVAGDGSVAAHTGKVEVGQGIRTALARLVAEELRIAPASVRVVMGDTARTPFDLGTFSSLSTRIVGTQLRRVAAAARELLLRLTAEAWTVDPGALVVAGGSIAHPPTGRSASFGAVAAGRAVVETVTRTDAVTRPEDWTAAGRDAPRAGGRALVTGGHRFASDLAVPGMLYGRVLRPPSLHAVAAAVDTRAAAAIPGVTVVRDGDFVGAAAPDEATAARAVAAIRAEWRTGAPPPPPWRPDDLRLHPVELRGRGGAFTHATGSAEEGWAAAAATLRRSYAVHFVAHAPLEPRAALARWDGAGLTVWTATQRPFAVRDELAAALGVAAHRVRVIVPDAGGAFGGKHTGEAALEAARLARAAGRPVKVVWTRAEEFTWAYFRPAGVTDVASGARADGTLTAWEFHVYNAGADAILPPYRIPFQRVEFHPVRPPLRQGAYRALAATANHFARETHLDELARALGLDPLALRRRNLDDPRLGAVLDAAAAAFGWGGARAPAGHGFGIAAGAEKGGFAAACAEVAVDGAGGVKVLRIVQAFECGAIVHPGHLRAQVEGAVIQGLGGALFEAVEFADGRVLNAAFSRYRVPRFSDVPPIEVVLLDRVDLPSAGAGETPIVCVAPALGNAIFDATGVRLRALPLVPRGLPPPPPASPP